MILNGEQLIRMATNEDLAIAFLCFAEKSGKDEIKSFIQQYASQGWEDEVNKQRLMEAIDLPTSHIQRKISLLHTSLYNCPNKKKIYEQMANQLSTLVDAWRSPLLNPMKKDKSFHAETNEWLMPLSLNSKGGT